MTQRPPQIGFIVRRECGWTFLQSRESQCTEGFGIAGGEQAYLHDDSWFDFERTRCEGYRRRRTIFHLPSNHSVLALI